ncbi:hypothetical protein SFR_3943 [Streptomyces sp. FR-008]|nr:hypothetical protein SFR_3943 [Streptomyces sp. FR-008]
MSELDGSSLTSGDGLRGVRHPPPPSVGLARVLPKAGQGARPVGSLTGGRGATSADSSPSGV